MPGAGFAEPRAGLSAAPGGSPDDSIESLAGRQVALIDLLDRLLNGGAVLTGDLVLSVADVDLVHINLRAVIRSITSEEPAPW
ncbi:MAG TPA: gas vesicle protein [Streptomyces sp.]|uniref:gas vesicle protein n=1 Tax=Streptomyces sp. TaxID=1931 RepID=UPI002B77850C|nr:gas vesicle protein [Streptomyces sp.]HWU11600.1 gas vesicle protein [Streptomyces sp.]